MLRLLVLFQIIPLLFSFHICSDQFKTEPSLQEVVNQLIPSSVQNHSIELPSQINKLISLTSTSLNDTIQQSSLSRVNISLLSTISDGIFVINATEIDVDHIRFVQKNYQTFDSLCQLSISLEIGWLRTTFCRCISGELVFWNGGETLSTVPVDGTSSSYCVSKPCMDVTDWTSDDRCLLRSDPLRHSCLHSSSQDLSLSAFSGQISYYHEIPRLTWFASIVKLTVESFKSNYEEVTGTGAYSILSQTHTQARTSPRTQHKGRPRPLNPSSQLSEQIDGSSSFSSSSSTPSEPSRSYLLFEGEREVLASYITPALQFIFDFIGNFLTNRVLSHLPSYPVNLLLGVFMFTRSESLSQSSLAQLLLASLLGVGLALLWLGLGLYRTSQSMVKRSMPSSLHFLSALTPALLLPFASTLKDSVIRLVNEYLYQFWDKGALGICWLGKAYFLFSAVFSILFVKFTRIFSDPKPRSNGPQNPGQGTGVGTESDDGRVQFSPTGKLSATPSVFSAPSTIPHSFVVTTFQHAIEGIGVLLVLTGTSNKELSLLLLFFVMNWSEVEYGFLRMYMYLYSLGRVKPVQQLNEVQYRKQTEETTQRETKKLLEHYRAHPEDINRLSEETQRHLRYLLEREQGAGSQGAGLVPHKGPEDDSQTLEKLRGYAFYSMLVLGVAGVGSYLELNYQISNGGWRVGQGSEGYWAMFLAMVGISTVFGMVVIAILNAISN